MRPPGPQGARRGWSRAPRRGIVLSGAVRPRLRRRGPAPPVVAVRRKTVQKVGHHEFLWRATKRQATHNRDFPQFDALIGSVEEALAYFASHPERVKALCTMYLDRMATATAPPLPTAA